MCHWRNTGEFKRHYKLQEQSSDHCIGEIEIFQYSIFNFKPASDPSLAMTNWITFLTEAHNMHIDQVSSIIVDPGVKKAFLQPD